jgi:hypothetical protein
MRGAFGMLQQQTLNRLFNTKITLNKALIDVTLLEGTPLLYGIHYFNILDTRQL